MCHGPVCPACRFRPRADGASCTGGYRQKFTAGRYRRQPTKNPIWMAAFSVGMRLNPPLA